MHAHAHLVQCHMLEHRLQVLLDHRQYQKLMHEARRRRLSAGAIVREAIDKLPDDLERRRAAIDVILAAEPMPVPADPGDLRAELDEAHDAFPA